MWLPECTYWLERPFKGQAKQAGGDTVELLSFGLRGTLRRVDPASLRDVPLSPDGGVIADYHGPVEDPAALAVWLSSTPGVVAHGLFSPQMVAIVLVGRGESADRIDFTPGN